MKIEGGSVVKSPWYYRTGTRPVGASRTFSYIATGIGPHTATVRSQLSVTSTLNLFLGNVTHWYRSVTAGTTGEPWGSYLTYDSTLNYGFSSSFLMSAGIIQTPTLTNTHHLGEYLTVSGDTIYLMTIDLTTGAHTANYACVCSVEWFGK